MGPGRPASAVDMTDDRNRQRSRTDNRVPPHNLDAEQSLLGAVFLSRSAVEIMVAGTEVRDFYRADHQHIAHAVRNVVASGAGVDVVTVADELRRAGLLDELDQGSGVQYLSSLMNATPAVSNAGRYAKIVRDTSTLRRLIAASSEIAEAAYLEPDDPSSAIGKAGELLAELSAGQLDALSAWDVADIAALLEGNLEPEQPTILRRSDGGALLYPGKVHALIAEPSSGKSWLACAAIVEILALGGSGIYLDFEDTATGILGRLLAVGATPVQLRTRFDYRNLSARFGPAERAELARLLERFNPDLVVIDGVAEALSREGLSEDKADDINRWMDTLPRPIARTGSAVLMLDHVAKDPEQRGRWARGSGAKLAAIDGASYQVKVRSSFSRHRPGKLELIVAKDRPGGVGAIGEHVADVHVEPHGNGERVVIRMEPHTVDVAPTDTWKPTVLMGKLYRALADAVVPLTAAGLLNIVHADKATMKKEALGRLMAEGYVAENPGKRRTLRILKPYDGSPNLAPNGHPLAPAWREPPPELFADDVYDGPTEAELDEINRQRFDT